MSSVLGTDQFAPPPYPIRPFSVAEYAELTRAGILTEEDAVELLEGWIVPKMPKHPPHDNIIDLINYVLVRILPIGWFVRVQNTITTLDSVPEPDLAVVRGAPGGYARNHPTSADVGLIIEVADSTVRLDRNKAAIYARAGVPHYWIVNLDENQIEVYSQPVRRGAEIVYPPAQIFVGDERISLIVGGTPVGSFSARELLGESVA